MRQVFARLNDQLVKLTSSAAVNHTIPSGLPALVVHSHLILAPTKQAQLQPLKLAQILFCPTSRTTALHSSCLGAAHTLVQPWKLQIDRTRVVEGQRV